MKIINEFSTKEASRELKSSYKTMKTDLAVYPMIPRPRKVGNGRGMGVRLVWSVETVEKLKLVKVLRQAGLNHDEVSKALKGK